MNSPPPIDQIKHQYAGVFLITDDGKVVGQQRDNKPTIDNPNRIGTFGGTIDADEDPLHAVWRELTLEETNLKIDQKEIKHLLTDVAWRALTKEWEARHFFYTQISAEQLNKLEVYEGQGWAYIKSPEDPLLIELWKSPTEALFKHITKEK
jgi:8-oxo-dGTP pyrophosphatase MutT (NUDIX family)